MQAILACISGYVGSGDSVTVGYSGGLDSTVLLHAAKVITSERGIVLSAIHVHHGLNRNADTWADFCTDTCGFMNIPIQVVRVKVGAAQGEGIEAAARRERHRVLAEHPAQWTLLAHHADDQAETLLHNLLRGTGVRGAAAMPARRGKVLRPFLGLAKSTLQCYADSNGLRWVEDDSNADSRFTRNYLRASVLPLLGERFNKAAEQLAAAAGRFGEASTLLDELAQIDLAGHPAGFPLPLKLLQELTDARARNLLRALLAWQRAQAPDEPRLHEFVRQLRTARSDRRPRLDLPTYSLWCEKGLIRFREADQLPEASGNRTSN